MTEITIPRGEFRDLASEILNHGGTVCFKARGASMSPFIRDGSRIRVQRIRHEALRIGDVVLYRSGAAIAVHRIVGKREENDRPAFVIRSDLFPFVNEFVNAEDVLGRVTTVLFLGKSFSVDSGAFRVAGELLARSRILAYLVTRSYGLLTRISKSLECY